MRFKKGSKVEVFYRREVPSGSWRCAEILSGNGHTYHVRYDHYPMDTGSAAERVPRKAIRPCPPFVEGQRCWVPGDIVEVFDNNSWKLAEVSRVFRRSCFFVRLLGSSMEFKVHSSDIRMRQSWEDNSWAIIQKDSSKRHNGTRSMLPKEGVFIRQELKTCLEENSYAGAGHLTVDNFVARVSSEGAKKRSCACSLFVETCAGAGKKMRTMKKEGSNHQQVAVNSPDSEKVDKKTFGENYMHASLNNRTNGFSGTQRGERNTNSAGYNYCSVSSDPSDAEIISSSVDSCSSTYSPYRLDHYPVNGLTQYLDSSDDSETSSLGREGPLNTEESPGEDIHLLELHAYRTTLMAFYASGPINWDLQALMTNLRCVLHISNDEHLMELRNLVYIEKDVSVR